jgi:hypothetical protein
MTMKFTTPSSEYHRMIIITIFTIIITTHFAIIMIRTDHQFKSIGVDSPSIAPSCSCPFTSYTSAAFASSFMVASKDPSDC